MEEPEKKIPATPGVLKIHNPVLLDIHKEQIDTVKSGYVAIRTLVSQVMVKKTDYGEIPGIKKEVLFKSGAEKIAKLLNLSPKHTCMNRIVRDDLILYEYKCELYNHEGRLMGDCEGACNSKEEKYRWVKTPLTSKEATDTELLKKLKAEGTLSKTDYGGETKYFRKVEKKDYYDIANTIMKMAEKRSFVGAILVVTGLSELFTQDMEDFKQQ